jgi:hypothetical protein
LFEDFLERKKEVIQRHQSITTLMDLLSEEPFPKILNYLFQRFVLKKKKPKGYMVPPITDLLTNFSSLESRFNKIIKRGK